MASLSDATYCRNCHKPLENTARFCPACGHEQGVAQPVDPPIPTRTSFPSTAGTRDSNRIIGYLAGILGGTVLAIVATLLLLGLIVVFAVRGCVSSIHNAADRTMHEITNK